MPEKILIYKRGNSPPFPVMSTLRPTLSVNSSGAQLGELLLKGRNLPLLVRQTDYGMQSSPMLSGEVDGIGFPSMGRPRDPPPSRSPSTGSTKLVRDQSVHHTIICSEAIWRGVQIFDLKKV